ncbi:hypothetical protein TeGR_g7121 [Tetraparma gracilis]|uniref:Uncharacterized protein n=1 Tax=Tetraparma gracilis TaxID=2962635 RepID=A0ABQ6MJC2_9STRA|nr:hypothetical protein TeGR_g7121 [Tetraparma gracilis]
MSHIHRSCLDLTRSLGTDARFLSLSGCLLCRAKYRVAAAAPGGRPGPAVAKQVASFVLPRLAKLLLLSLACGFLPVRAKPLLGFCRDVGGLFANNKVSADSVHSAAARAAAGLVSGKYVQFVLHPASQNASEWAAPVPFQLLDLLDTYVRTGGEPLVDWAVRSPYVAVYAAAHKDFHLLPWLSPRNLLLHAAEGFGGLAAIWGWLSVLGGGLGRAVARVVAGRRKSDAATAVVALVAVSVVVGVGVMVKEVVGGAYDVVREKVVTANRDARAEFVRRNKVLDLVDEKAAEEGGGTAAEEGGGTAAEEAGGEDGAAASARRERQNRRAELRTAAATRAREKRREREKERRRRNGLWERAKRKLF